MNTIIIEKKSKYDIVGEKELKGFLFALKARDAKNNRAILRGVFVDDGLVICTDGTRLHIFATGLDIENGIYEVVSSKASMIVLKKSDTDCTYPDYKKVIPAVKWDMTINCNGAHYSLFQAVYQNFANECVSYSTDYLHDAYMDNSDVSIMKDKNNNWSPLVMYDNDSRAAVVMPLKNN